MVRPELLLDHLLQLYKAQRGASLKINFSEKTSAFSILGHFNGYCTVPEAIRASGAGCCQESGGKVSAPKLSIVRAVVVKNLSARQKCVGFLATGIS